MWSSLTPVVNGTDDVARRADRIRQVYIADIERLLKMEDMWAHRKPPRPLSWDQLSAPAAAAAEEEERTPAAASGAAPTGNGTAKGVKSKEDEARIDSQKKLSVRDSFALFVDACVVPLPSSRLSLSARS